MNRLLIPIRNIDGRLVTLSYFVSHVATWVQNSFRFMK